ncbi:MAG TPA: hypothetical protein VKB78_00825, partial [Pirellulales bacterium]|nr:hypothetical protein [Pirellulales bacterium]
MTWLAGSLASRSSIAFHRLASEPANTLLNSHVPAMPLGHSLTPGAFPTVRMRRLRHNPRVRELVREVQLSPGNFVLPLFVRPGRGVRRAIDSLPGHFQLSIDELAPEIRRAAELKLGGVLLFGIPADKDAVGSDAFSDTGIVQQAIGAIREIAPEMLVITDVCCCEYTDHGHCGIVNEKTGRPDVDNDATLE